MKIEPTIVPISVTCVCLCATRVDKQNFHYFQNPINTRDATVSALSDAQYVAPLIQSGDLLSGAKMVNDEEQPSRQTRTYFYVYDYQTKDGLYPQVIFFIVTLYPGLENLGTSVKTLRCHFDIFLLLNTEVCL